MSPAVKRNVLRGLLALHFMGLGLSIGTRFADMVIDNKTAAGGLQSLAFGRDLTSMLARSLVLPGFLLLIVTGVAMVGIRYGRRIPLWVAIKFCVAMMALALGALVVSPALATAKSWADWSAVHGQAAPQLHASIARAEGYGAIVLVLFLFNILVAIWKPVVKRAA